MYKNNNKNVCRSRLGYSYVFLGGKSEYDLRFCPLPFNFSEKPILPGKARSPRKIEFSGIMRGDRKNLRPYSGLASQNA